jgi:RNA polymerase sigma-70 factor (ECF subfamily)
VDARPPDVLGWSDVLHEAIARALDGLRKWPSGVPILAFLIERHTQHLRRPLAARAPREPPARARR